MENNTTNQKDPQLWETAKKRASFKSSLVTYLIVNAFLWAIWYFRHGGNYSGSWPWPIWPTLGWGVGLIFQYFGAYVNTGGAEGEYEKLKRKQENKSTNL